MKMKKDTNTSGDANRLWTTELAAWRLNVCPRTVARYTRAGLLPCVKLNSRLVRYRPEDVEAFIQDARI